jgi:hypothetical protein
MCRHENRSGTVRARSACACEPSGQGRDHDRRGDDVQRDQGGAEAASNPKVRSGTKDSAVRASAFLSTNLTGKPPVVCR